MKPIGRPRKRRDATTKQPEVPKYAIDEAMGEEEIRRGFPTWTYHEDGSWTRPHTRRALGPDTLGGWYEIEVDYPEMRFMYDDDGEVVPWEPKGGEKDEE